jgi:hypothetical protein
LNKKAIKHAINTEQRGRILSWEKHQKVAVQRELEAAIHDARSLPQNESGIAHSFQDVLTVELDEYVPGSAYLRRQAKRNSEPFNGHTKQTTHCELILF